MKNLELKSRRLLRTIFGCIGLTAVAFVFQACYGPRPDRFDDVEITDTVKMQDSDLSVEDVGVVDNDNDELNE